jgi:CTP:molybdopterin cytidylyltransferase MocA
MGRPKALLPWHGVTLIEYQIACLIEGGVAEVVVVLGDKAEAIAPYVRGAAVRHVVNRQHRLGRASSIRAGLRAVAPEADAFLLLAVDQPRTAQVISTIIAAHRQSDALITSPRYRGRGGHPLILSSRLKDEIGGISEEKQGIREVFEAHRGEITEVEVDDPVIRLDLNTPEDYREAKERYGA